MRVLVLSRYDTLPGPSRYRIFQFLPYLEQRGCKVTVSALLDNAYVGSYYDRGKFPIIPMPRLYWRRALRMLRAGGFDVIWLEKEALPWIPAEIEQWLGLRKAPYVVDYDDAIFHTYDQHRFSIVRRLLGAKIGKLMSNAAVVLAGNEYLADHARRSGARRIEILPSVVNLARYPHRTGDANRAFTIGWTGAPANSRHLLLIKEALARVCQGGKARLHVIGGWKIDLPPEIPVEYTPFSASDDVEPVQRFDVGIMPLEDSHWERGKCGMKLVHYMACGLPSIASPIGVNARLIDPGVTGFLARTESEWIASLEALSADCDLRERMGRAAKQTVETHHSLSVYGPRVAAWICDAGNRSQ